MGDPKRIRKAYSRPGHPWQKVRIEEEKKLLGEYGLKNKKEIWRMETELKNIMKQAKKLIAAIGVQAEKEQKQLLNKLQKLGLLKKDAKLEDVLSLTLKDILERRLQTQILKKNMAKTIKQARQFITHAHVIVAKKKITSPSYLLNTEEEQAISFASNSPLSKETHPEKVVPEK